MNSISTQSLISEIKEIPRKIDSVYGKEVILVIGNTGAGKSTLINYLAGKVFKKIQTPLEILVDCDHPIMAIGHGQTSKTEIPEIFSEPSSGLTFCDCPGFFDTKSVQQQIVNAYAMRSLSKTCRAIKGAILCVDFVSLTTTRGKGFDDAFRMTSSLLGNPKNSLFVLITKAAGIVNDPQAALQLLAGQSHQIATLLYEGKIGFYSPMNDLPAGVYVYTRETLEQRIKQMMQGIPSLNLALNPDASLLLDRILITAAAKIKGHLQTFPAKKIVRWIQIKEQLKELGNIHDPTFYNRFLQFDQQIDANLQLVQHDPQGIQKLEQLRPFLPSFQYRIDATLARMRAAVAVEQEKAIRISQLEWQIHQLQNELSSARQQLTQATHSSQQVSYHLQQQERAVQESREWERKYRQEKSAKEALQEKAREIEADLLKLQVLIRASSSQPVMIVRQGFGHPAFY